MLAHGLLDRFNEIFLIENFSLHEHKKAGCNRVSDMTIEYTLSLFYAFVSSVSHAVQFKYFNGYVVIKLSIIALFTQHYYYLVFY